MSTDSLLTSKQVASTLNMTPEAVRHRMRRQQLPGVKMGREWRMKASDLQAYIDSLTGTPPQPVTTDDSQKDGAV